MAIGSFKIDKFLLAMMAVVALASVLPVRGPIADWADVATDIGIALLFFLHGAKLSTSAIRAGIGAYRVHILVVIATFVLFPLIGLAIATAGQGVVDPVVLGGLLFLTIVPSTVQSSVAFTSIAGGNVPAAICSASISNLLGIALTPLLAVLLLSADNVGTAISLAAVEKIALKLLVPFLAGHLMRPLIGSWVDKHKALVGRVDRSTILTVVYTAFSAAIVNGLWQRFGPGDILTIAVLDALILAVMLGLTYWTARIFSLPRDMEIVLLFAGSKKSLASGVPIAAALFPAMAVGPIILPLMLFHQMQLMVCSMLAARYSARSHAPLVAAGTPGAEGGKVHG